MRRTISAAGVLALLAVGLGLPAASAAPAAPGSGDRPDSLRAAKSAAAAPTGRWVHERLGSARDVDWFRFAMPRDGHALVTLGHLPADYSLAVFSRDGSRVAGSDQPGTHFELVDHRFAAGDYFVRVAAHRTVDRSVRYALQFRPVHRGVVVAEQRDVGDVDGFDIKGELLNNTRSWQQVLRVHVTWLDKSGRAVGTHDEGVIPGPLAPRQRVEFGVEAQRGSADLPAGATAYRLRVDERKTDERAPKGLVVEPGGVSTAKAQRLYEGTVTNTSQQTLRGIYPTVIEYDSLGRATAFGYDRITSLAPGRSRDYQAVIDIHGLPTPNAYREYASVTRS